MKILIWHKVWLSVALYLTIIVILFKKNVFYVFETTPQASFTDLLNITNFEFLIQQPECSADPLDLLVLVHTAPKNFLKRQAIRHTWGNYTENSKFGKYRILFLLGMVHTKVEQAELILENGIFEDLVQGNFIDHYHNMTYKHVMALKWFENFCSNAKLLLKVDDDVLVNLPYILTSTKTNFWQALENEDGDFIFCKEWAKPLIDRNNNSKWYVSKNDVPGFYYPNFCSGSAIFYAPHTVKVLLNEIKFVKYLFMDDVFVTGLARNRTKISITHYGIVWNNKLDDVKKIDRNQKIKNFFIGPYNIEITDEYWKKIQILNQRYNIA
ncbi:beta-1,3-galactosyltransferase 5-like [Culicoides brevitarsis]|uniref:beta-1,3-galactosyltransferase 5-like n=1 Tax=Culicoides brevitarsis TaxID=469753 RepID=UPI00307BC162